MFVQLRPLSVAQFLTARHGHFVDHREREPHRQIGAAALDGLFGRAVAESHSGTHRCEFLSQHHVGGAVTWHPCLAAGRLQRRAFERRDEVGQTHPREQLGKVRLVEGHGQRDPVAESIHDHSGKAREECGRLRIEPSAACCEPMRRREVVEGDDGGETPRAAPVDDRFVMIESLLRELALRGLDPRPLHGEAEGVQAHSGHEVQVGLPQLPAVRRLAGSIPEGRRRDVLKEPRVAVDVVALVLVAGGRDTPEEVAGKSGRVIVMPFESGRSGARRVHRRRAVRTSSAYTPALGFAVRSNVSRSTSCRPSFGP